MELFPHYYKAALTFPFLELVYRQLSCGGLRKHGRQAHGFGIGPGYEEDDTEP